MCSLDPRQCRVSGRVARLLLRRCRVGDLEFTVAALHLSRLLLIYQSSLLIFPYSYVYFMII